MAPTTALYHPKVVAKSVRSKDGTEIFSEAMGDPSKPHVVFVHGLACAGAVWDPIFQLAEMHAEIYAVRYDTRGHGRSGKPETEEGFEQARYSEDFEAIVKEYKLNNPIYVGWSLAGTIACDIIHAGIPISGIVYVGALPHMGDIMGIVCTPLVLSFVPGLCTMDDVTLALKTRLEFCRTLMAPKYFQNVPFPDYSAWIGATCWLPPKQATLALTRKQDTTKFYEAGKNGMPLLIIHGLEDLQVSAKDVVEQIQPKFTDCQVELLEGVGHIPFYEEPDKTFGPILDFVRRKYKPL